MFRTVGVPNGLGGISLLECYIPDKESKMQPHEERVIQERKELSDRMQKLAVFLDEVIEFKNLSKKEQNLLQRQYEIMNDYLSILNERIALFGEKK